MTPARRKALEILRDHGPMRPYEFARRMLPDSGGWTKHHKVVYGVSPGAGMPSAAGGFLGKLKHAGLVEKTFRHRFDNAYQITSAGRAALKRDS